MAEDGNLYSNNNNNNLSNFTNIETREFILTTTTTTATNTSSSGTIPTSTTETLLLNEQGLSERDATHFRLRNNGIIQGFETITCLSCGESFASTSLLEIFDHYKERSHLRHYSNCLYCQGKVHQYYNDHQQQVNYYHNCLRWKRGEDH